MCEPCNLAVTCSREGCDRLNDTVYICDVCNGGYVCANCLGRRLSKEAEYMCEACTRAMQQVFVLTREPKDTDEWLEQMAAAVHDAQTIRRKKRVRV